MLGNRPVIAVPMGDPAGIGPEIVLRAAMSEEAASKCRFFVIGDERILRRALSFPNMPEAELHVIEKPEEGIYRAGVLNVIDLGNLAPEDYELGVVQAQCGRAAYEYIERAIRMALEGSADAVSTTPINKEALHAAGIPHIGHTEIFGALTGTPDPMTIFEVKNTMIFFLTRHVSLRKACDMVTKERLVDHIRRSLAAMKQLGVEDGTMAVAGLNPHCGEHGLFGDEEMNAVLPAVEELQKEGCPVVGPIGADSVFFQAFEGRYKSVMSLYHDQGHIAAKTADFYRTISITAGMPFLRTSVDHGTAFDVAGKGLATGVSMEEAILVAAKYSGAALQRAPFCAFGR